jgi:hypothetical protein
MGRPDDVVTIKCMNGEVPDSDFSPEGRDVGESAFLVFGNDTRVVMDSRGSNHRLRIQTEHSRDSDLGQEDCVRTRVCVGAIMEDTDREHGSSDDGASHGFRVRRIWVAWLLGL